MANLGTQDMAQYMAANAIRRGDTNMGLGYMLGSMLANAWNRHDTKKQQRKMDAFLNGQKADDIDFSKFGDATENALPAGGSVQNQAPAFDANNVIQPEGSNAVDQYLKDQKVNGFNEYMATAPRTPKPFNPNRMQEFEAWARENNLRDEVAKKGRERVQREQMEDAEALYMPTIRQGIYGYTDKDNKFHAPDNNSRIQALNALDELVKYSPDKANLYAKLGLAEMSEANKFERNRAAAREDANTKLSNAVTLANIKGSNQVATKLAGKANNGPKVTLSDYNSAIEKMAELRELNKGKPLDKWSPEHQRMFFTMANVANAYDVNFAQSNPGNNVQNIQGVPNTNRQNVQTDNGGTGGSFETPAGPKVDLEKEFNDNVKITTDSLIGEAIETKDFSKLQQQLVNMGVDKLQDPDNLHDYLKEYLMDGQGYSRAEARDMLKYIPSSANKRDFPQLFGKDYAKDFTDVFNLDDNWQGRYNKNK